MPTNEERREVARKLRAKYKERNAPGMFSPQDACMQAYDYLKDLVDCLPDGDSAFTVLADLIEPEPKRTCCMEFVMGAGMYRCSACGEYHIQAAHAIEKGVWHFCPNCGARAVES